ncbi:Fructosamine kinase-domain-containing protein [Xylaria venustula]|nr:Fructosamine kinase-domain-containing protein [Xylaria venustula]
MNTALQALVDSTRGQSFPYSGDFRVDDNVLAQFPSGTQILSVKRLLKSKWTVTACIHMKIPGGLVFLKSATRREGQTQMEGEYNAMCELYKWAPDFVPKPLAFGQYATLDSETSFFLSEFIEMGTEMPDPERLCAKLAHLHSKSQSPTGKFGFQITTCQGHVPQHVCWEKSWTTFFASLLQHVARLDFESNGYWNELDIVEKRLISDVVPRLLGALETEGRSIKPSLIHADLWEGNVGTSSKDGEIYIFDSAAFYAHNEMEIGNWRCHYNKIHDEKYTASYLQRCPPSEPEEEWEDRNRLYSVYFNIIYSVNHLDQGLAVRQVAYNDICYLIDRFSPFQDGNGPSKLNTSEMAKLSKERDHTAE